MAETPTLTDYNTGQNNWYTATGVAKIKKPDGTEVPNPFDLTAEEIYFALAGDAEAVARLKQSLAARGKDDLFHNIVNYYEPGGGAYNGGGYNAQDSANAQANFRQGMRTGGSNLGQRVTQGTSPEALQYQLANGQIIKGPDGNYYYPADPYYAAGGGGAGTKEAAAYNGVPAAQPSPSGPPPASGLPPPVTNAPTPGGTPTTPGATTPPGGSTNLGNTGASGDFPMASAAQATPYTAAPRPASTTDPFSFLNDEGYKFIRDEGTKGIQGSAAARGQLKSGNTLKELAKFQTGLASQEYGKAFDRYNTDRNFAEGQYTGDRAFDYGAQTDTRNYNNANRMWDTSFNNSNRIDARNFDYGAAVGDRNFNYMKDVGNRDFAYNASTGDRAFNAATLNSLAQMGLSGSQSSGTLAAALAQILGQNTMTGAGAGANATVGTGNNTNAFISQLLQMLYGNSIVNSVKP